MAFFACKKKQSPADAATLAQIFAAPDDAAAPLAHEAEPAASASSEALPELKSAATPQFAAPKPKPAGNKNLPECLVAHAFCDGGKRPIECEKKKQECLQKGGAF